MGGIIDAQSEGPGKGTKMVFSLPVWRTEQEEPITDVEQSLERVEGPLGGPLILIVEDDAVFRKYLTSMLHVHGYRTVEALHAEAGWLLVRRLQPALVVLDYALASSDNAMLRTGWDLAERMTMDSATRHIPMIFVTGFDLQIKERLQAALFSRKPEHLLKPVDASVLVQKIAEMVGPSHQGLIRVLMADDDPSVLAYVRKVLPESTYHIEVANNGDECLHILRTQPHGFDLLLLDLMMPDVSGYDVLRELSLSESYRDLPVLILTNFPEARTED
jgi:CheY-like chemotaxis protein